MSIGPPPATFAGFGSGASARRRIPLRGAQGRTRYGTVGQLVFLVSSMQNGFGGNCFSYSVNLVFPPTPCGRQLHNGQDAVKMIVLGHGPRVHVNVLVAVYASIQVNAQVAEIIRCVRRSLGCDAWLCHVSERTSGVVALNAV